MVNNINQCKRLSSQHLLDLQLMTIKTHSLQDPEDQFLFKTSISSTSLPILLGREFQRELSMPRVQVLMVTVKLRTMLLGELKLVEFYIFFLVTCHLFDFNWNFTLDLLKPLSWTKLARRLQSSSGSQLLLESVEQTIVIVIPVVSLLSSILRKETTIWLETTHQYSSLGTQSSSLTLSILKKDILKQGSKIQTWLLISGVIHQKLFIRSPFFFLIEVHHMVLDTWMVTAHIHLSGLMEKVSHFWLNTTLRLPKGLKTSQMKKLPKKEWKTRTLQRETYITHSWMEAPLLGTGSCK